MSNEITLTVKVSRVEAKGVGIFFYREGHGDDFVEQRADQVEAVVKDLAQKLVAQCGGKLGEDFR